MTSHPALTLEQWKALQNKRLTAFLERVSLAVTPFTCLSANSVAHIRSDWITWRDNHVRITVPKEAPCNEFKIPGQGGGRGELPPLVRRETSCSYCQNHGKTDHFERLSADQNTEPGAHTVVLNRTLGEPAVNILKEIFKTHRRPELGATPSGVTTAARNLVDRSEVEKPDGYTYTVLRRTGVAIYCHYGLSAPEIADLAPYTQNTVELIIGSTPGVGLEKIDSRAFLKAVAENEPVTPKTLQDKLEKSQSTIYDRLYCLEDSKRVKRNPTEGNEAATWETTKDWKSPFQCENCEFETYSLNSLSKHHQHCL